MYHLPIAATWLQEQRIAPVFGMRPMSFYGLQPAGGAVWLWWWLAPSHSEIYVNLAGFLPAALLALATGAVARELGARQAWPLAGFLILLAPVVLRFNTYGPKLPSSAEMYVQHALGDRHLHAWIQGAAQEIGMRGA